MSPNPENSDPAKTGILSRLWIYQKERFPLVQTSILVGFFTAATICVSAQLAGRPLPGTWSFLAVWISVLIIFFQMRACDEYKDLETDTQYRPERPIPRGLVRLQTILFLAAVAGMIAIAATASISLKLLIPLALVWTWLFIMTKEFFVAEWLISKPFLYLISHMAIMPIIDLYISGAEWIEYGNSPPHGLWIFLVLSFLNGCVLEFGRKIWAPENEREGVDTYSGLLGPQKAVRVWAGFCSLAGVFLIWIAFKLNAGLWIAIPTVLTLFYIGFCANKFSQNPTPKAQKNIDTLAGLWVVMCYGLAGFMPLLKTWILA